MPLLKAEADKLTNNDLVAGIIEEIITVDATYQLLPFVKTEGKAYVYNRENVLATVDFLDPNDNVNEGASSFTEVTTRLRVLAGDVDVDNFIAETESTVQSQKATQIALKAKAMANAFRNAMVNGSNGTNPKEFDGVRALATGGQTIAAGTNGAALTMSMLDDLVDRVPNGPDAIIMRRGTLRAYRALLRATSGTDAAQVMIKDFGAVLGHNGIPILVNDFLPTNEVQGTSGGVCTSVYAVRMNEVDGLHGLYGGEAAGIRVEDVGIVQNKDATRTRLKWYCGLALKSTRSLARLSGITNT